MNVPQVFLETNFLISAFRALRERFDEVQKFFDFAEAEISRTRAGYKRELGDFAADLGDGVLHASDDVFDCLEELVQEGLFDSGGPKNPSGNEEKARGKGWITDAMILRSVLTKARQLQKAGVNDLYFASTDKKAFEPRPERPKLSQHFADAGLNFVYGFDLPEPAAPSP